MILFARVSLFGLTDFFFFIQEAGTRIYQGHRLWVRECGRVMRTAARFTRYIRLMEDS
jgi:hypothetical protein